jgi:hypothetical protein
MSHPGRVGVTCRDCGADLQEVGGWLRCPWAHGRRAVNCGRPYGAAMIGRRTDEAGEYLRDEARKR